MGREESVGGVRAALRAAGAASPAQDARQPASKPTSAGLKLVDDSLQASAHAYEKKYYVS
jgi:hypothetical protein